MLRDGQGLLHFAVQPQRLLDEQATLRTDVPRSLDQAIHRDRRTTFCQGRLANVASYQPVGGGLRTAERPGIGRNRSARSGLSVEGDGWYDGSHASSAVVDHHDHQEQVAIDGRRFDRHWLQFAGPVNQFVDGRSIQPQNQRRAIL